MKKTSKYTIVLGLVSALTTGLGTSLQADDTTPAPTTPAVTPAVSPAKSGAVVTAAPNVISGKIVVVDRIARTITINVDGKLKLLKVGPKVKMVDNGKLVTFESLTAGQTIAVLTRENVDGSIEVVALSVEPSDAKVEAAGKSSAKGKGAGVTGIKPNGAQFQTFPNPANNLGPIISPSR